MNITFLKDACMLMLLIIIYTFLLYQAIISRRRFNKKLRMNRDAKIEDVLAIRIIVLIASLLITAVIACVSIVMIYIGLNMINDNHYEELYLNTFLNTVLSVSYKYFGTGFVTIGNIGLTISIVASLYYIAKTFICPDLKKPPKEEADDDAEHTADNID